MESVRIYLDVSCLNRPFDDQRQSRIRLEAEAVMLILRRVDLGVWAHISSDMVQGEILATTDAERRNNVLRMLPSSSDIMPVTEAVFRRAVELGRLGVRPADAVHVAAAEAQRTDALITCDDQLLRVSRRHQAKLRVRVCDPIRWVKEHEDKPNT